MANKYLEKIADGIQNHRIGMVGRVARAVGRSALEGSVGATAGSSLALAAPGVPLEALRPATAVSGLAGTIHGAIKSWKNTSRNNALYDQQHPGM